MRIAVAGGTGLVGKHVCRQLHEAGHVPVVLSRATSVDLATGRGLDAALASADGVVDVSDLKTQRAAASRSFFRRSTYNLLQAGQRAGVAHHVVLSIVGVDQVDLGYYVGKREQEQLVLDASGVGTVLRATQFHEFAGQVVDRVPGPVAVVPRMLIQPVAVHEVATALVELVVGSPVGRASDLAGPLQQELPDLVRRLLLVRGQRRLVLPVRLPGAGGRAAAHGGLLPAGPTRLGRQTFEQWLEGPDGPSQPEGPVST